MIQDIRLFLMVSKHEFFMPLLICLRINLRKRLFLHIPANFMEFFDASPSIAPKREVSDSLKEKRKKKKQKRKGVYCYTVSDSEKSWNSSREIISLYELIM